MSSRSLIVADANITAVENVFSDLGEVKLVEGRTLTADHLAEAEILLVRSVTRVDAQLLKDSQVTFVGTATSGTDHVDLDYLASRRIAFAHAPGSNANSVVEYVLTAIASQGDALESLLGGERVGIVGFGRIGQLLAARLDALGIGWLACDPWRDEPMLVSLDAVLACRVVCLHAELTLAEPHPSRHLLGSGQLSRLGEGQLLINAGRGALVDNAALLDRLRETRPPSVVLDVWENEPDIDPALLEAVNLGTPHIAGYSYDGKLKATTMLRQSVASAMNLPLAAEQPTPSGSPALVVPTDLDDPAFIRAVLQSCYDVHADDRALRETMARDGHGAGFDGLRKHYPVRWELMGRGLAGTRPGQESHALLRALGVVASQGVEA